MDEVYLKLYKVMYELIPAAQCSWKTEAKCPTELDYSLASTPKVSGFERSSNQFSNICHQ